MKAVLFAASAMLALLAPHGAAAQDEAPPAPRLAREFAGQPVFGQLALTAQPDWSALDAPGAPMRDVAVLTPPDQWFARDAALVAAFLAAPDAPLHAYFTVAVDPAGRVSSCRFERPPTLPVGQDALCGALKERLRFRPAIDLTGTPVPAAALIGISAVAMPGSAEAAPPPLFRPEMMPPPAPPPPPPPPKLRKWPPEARWVQFNSTPARFRTALAATAPTDAVGLVYGAKDAAVPGCEVFASSGDPARDAEACRWVENRLKPTWGRDTAPNKRHAALLVGMKDAEPSAFAADMARGAAAKPVAGREQAFFDAIVAVSGAPPQNRDDALALSMLIDAEGRVSHCRIARSSGSDAGDVGACRTAREDLWFTPAIDVFGRPQAGGFRYWNAATARADLAR